MDVTIEKTAEFSDTFVELAKRQGVTGLDYSPASLRVVDDLLGDFHANGERPDQLQGTMLIASCYVGEVFRKTTGAEWIDGNTVDMPEDMRFPLMMQLDDIQLIPFGKVFKRVENGEEDDLVFYYQVMLQQAGLPAAPDIPPRKVASRPTPKSSWLSRLFGRKL